LNATLNKITKTDSNNPAIIFTTTGLTEGSTLAAGQSQTLTVKVEYSNSVTSQPSSTKSELSVTLDYVQEGTTGGTPGGSIDNLTGTFYRNNTNNYLINGKSIDDTTLVYYPSNDYTSVEDAVADGYFFINESDCIAEETTCASGLVTLSIGDYVDNPSSLGKFYLKHVIENNIVQESYVCFITDTEHCMQGGSPNYYETNKTLLQGQQAWFTNNGGSCTFDDPNSYCHGGGFSNVNAIAGGYVAANDDASACTVFGDGFSGCIEYSGSAS